MSIRIRVFSNALATILLAFVLLSPVDTVSAIRTSLAPPMAIIRPASIVSTRGTTVGSVARLRVQDQSGSVDTPAKYVLFQTPGLTYLGYRTYNAPSSVSPGTVTAIKINVNYKGPAKASQTWSWNLYDWVHATWVKVGDNTGAAANVWKPLQFSVAVDASRFVNNSTRQMRLQLSSSNAAYDAKLDYEAITLTYRTCTDPLGCVLVPPGGAMHIAYLLNMPGLESRNGAEVAKDAAGTILGHAIRFDGLSRAACDTATTLADGVKMAADASVLAVVGTSCSAEAQAVLPVFSAAGFSMVSPSNTTAYLTDPGTPGYLRVSWNDNQQGEIAADYVWNTLGVTKVATIDDGSGYSLGLVQSFADTFVALGGTITGQKSIAPDQVDMGSMLSFLAGGAPDLIYFPFTMPAGGYIINQARVTTGLTSVYLMASDGLLDPWVMLATGSDLEGFRVTGIDWMQFSPDYASPGGFIDDYMAKYGVKPSVTAWAAYGYDAFNVIKAAIENAAVDQGDGSYLIGRQALRTALYATSAFPGLTGTLTCHADGDCAETPALGIYEYHAGVADPTKIWP
jgi:branched-chain amino acid transport system substrate-binding protein